jgi:hypothetical protein
MLFYNWDIYSDILLSVSELFLQLESDYLQKDSVLRSYKAKKNEGNYKIFHSHQGATIGPNLLQT